MAALNGALYEIRQRAFPQGLVTVDALVYLDAVQRFGEALADRSVKVFRDFRLETSLVSAVSNIGDLGIDAAKQRDERTAYYTAVKLAILAESAEQDIYREYPADLAADLVGLGLLSEEHSLEVPGMGEQLADFVAEQLVDHLSDSLDHAMHEALMAGKYGYVDHATRIEFVRRVAARAGRTFGLNLAPSRAPPRHPVAWPLQILERLGAVIRQFWKGSRE